MTFWKGASNSGSSQVLPLPPRCQGCCSPVTTQHLIFSSAEKWGSDGKAEGGNTIWVMDPHQPCSFPWGYHPSTPNSQLTPEPPSPVGQEDQIWGSPNLYLHWPLLFGLFRVILGRNSVPAEEPLPIGVRLPLSLPISPSPCTWCCHSCPSQWVYNSSHSSPWMNKQGEGWFWSESQDEQTFLHS